MSNFTYTANIPQASQKISSTQQPILNNFIAIQELLAVNHVGFSDTTNFGKHTFTTLPFQNSDPSTTSTEMALYAKATGSPNAGEIFYRYPSNGTIAQLSGSSTGETSQTTDGYSYLPGSILMKWGQATGIVTGTNTIIFPTSNIPAFTTSLYTVHYFPAVSYTPSTTCAYISSSSITQFVLEVPGTMSTTISWLAIGV
jgi:hypothetical protein